MRTHRREVPVRGFLAGVVSLILFAFPAAAEDSADVAAPAPLAPQSQNGATFLTGGVGDREQAELRKLDDDYNVRIALTNADGAYISRVDVVIEDAAGRSLIETTTRGPIVLAQLEPGRYRLQARSEGRTTERRVIDVPKNAEAVRLYVALEDTGAE
jgi:hypothetical protein